MTSALTQLVLALNTGLPALHQQDNTSSTTLELIIKDRAIWTETDECHDQNMG